MLARACGKTNVHSLEPEDLAALTMEASAMAQVPLAGTDYTVGVDRLSQARYEWSLPIAKNEQDGPRTARSARVASEGASRATDIDKYLKMSRASTPRASSRSASTSAIATTSISCPTTTG